MVVEFEFPDVGEGVTEGTLVSWLVSVGDTVEEDQSLAEVETDKAVVEVPSPVDGTVQELHAEEGEVIKVGNVLVTLAEEGEEPGGAAEEEMEGKGTEEQEAAEDEVEPATEGTAEEEESAGTEEEPAEAEQEEAEESGAFDYDELVQADIDDVKRRVDEEDLDLEAVLTAERRHRNRDELERWLENRIEGMRASGTSIVGELEEGERGVEKKETQEEPEPAADGGEAAGDVLATPAVRKLARDEGVDLAAVEATGSGGRVTREDVERHLEGGTAEEEAADAGGTEAAAEPEAGKRVLATPSTRRLAREEDVDIAAVEGSGPGGRVTKEDVRAAAAGAEAEEETEEAERAEAPGAAPSEAEETAMVEGAAPGTTFGSSGRRFEPMDVDFSKWGEVEREEMSGTRRSIAQRMERSKYTAPHVTATDKADVTELWEVRKREKEVAATRDVHLTFMPFIVKAVVSALRDYPLLNASLDERTGEIVKKNYYNIGVAVATDDGLLVPNVKDADQKSILALGRRINELAERAREREIDLEEMRGGTFTLSNWGSIGGRYGTPIINYPEVGVLGIGTIHDEPAVVDGEVEPRKLMPLSLTFDHRVVDGAYAAQFMNEVVAHLEDPDLLLIDE